jgi:SAM-dependent methyltransferase
MANPDPAARPAPPPDDENTPEYREWLAAAYDTDVYEQWLRPFEELLHRRIEPVAKGMALEVGCATGRGTQKLLEALGERVRLVAQEDRGFLLDLARARMADHVGSRLFFNSDPLPRLRYDEKVFSTVVANLSWWERPDRVELLAEMARILDDEGMVVLTAPLAGTFGELIDLAREVVVKLDLASKLEPRIAALEALFATPEDWVEEVESLGLVQARVDCTEVELPFSSSRELFSSTLAQARWLGLWRKAFGEDDKRLVWHIRQMIDAYWADSPFTLTVAAGCLTARRPKDYAPRRAAEKPAPAEEAAVVPVVMAGDSDVDRAPAYNATIPPPRADSFYASGDAIAAELLGMGAGARGAARRVPTPLPDETVAGEPEPLEPEPIEPEAIEVEPVEELGPAAAEDPLEEVEPYVPDEADLHSPVGGSSESRPSVEDLARALDEGSGMEFGPEDPVPLGTPRAAPVRPVDLGEPQFRPVAPVDLDDSTVEQDDSFPDWDERKR